MLPTLYIMLLALAVILVLSLAFVLRSRRQLAAELHRRLAAQDEQIVQLSSRLADATKKMDELATVDPLTDLNNRRGMERILSAEVNRAKRTGTPLVGLLLDCDDFKRINETLGHAVGDVVLKEMVQRITSTLRPSDFVARIGGDEFVILLTETQLAEATLIAERVRLSVAESPIRNSDDNIFMTASLGVAPLPYEISSVEELLTLTRHALKKSKTNGKNRVTSVEVIEGKNGTELVSDTQDIVQVLRQGECFRCASHAIHRLDDDMKIGYELLSRGPKGAFEMPYDFFRVAIENNMLTRVDLCCLKTCIAAAANLEKGLRFDVNLYPSTILDTPIDRLVAIFPEDKAIGTFCVEISEQQFIGDPSYLKEHTQALKNAGIQVAIDDVGFGRSSLESLIILEPDVVKVDIKYVSGIAHDPQKQRLLQRLVRVVTALGAELIAEGVENREDLEVVKDMGVMYAQGYLWGKPSIICPPP